MRLSLEYSEPFRLSVFLVYRRSEWEKLKILYRNKGLEPYTTNNLFDQGITAHVYRYTQNIPNVFKDINTSIDGYDLILIDDINKPFINVVSRSIFLNYAIFRVMPDCSNDECYISFKFDLDSTVPYNIMLQAVRTMLREVKTHLNDGKLKWKVEVWTE